MNMSDLEHGPSGLGRAIAVRRAELGLKRKELADRAKLSYPYVSELENGTKEPSARALRQLAEALDLSPTELLALSESYTGEALESPALQKRMADSKSPSASAARAEAQLLSFMTALQTTPGPTEPNASTELADLVARLVREQLERFRRDELPGLVAVELQRTLTKALQQGNQS